jgi:hypothetical protein
MTRETMRGLSFPRRLLPALLLAALACLAAASPALALDLNPANYFQISYDPITFDKTRVAPGEVFHTTIKGQAVCNKTIPVPVSEATVTSKVIARGGGTDYTLNPSFTIDINPFPDKAGQTYDINLPLDLQFPVDAPPGDYDVVWQLVQARAKISFIWTDVTSSLPAEQAMSAVTVTNSPPPSSTVIITNPQNPQSSTTITVPPPPPFTVGPTTSGGVPLWLLPLIIGALIIAVIVIIIFAVVLRHRRD